MRFLAPRKRIKVISVGLGNCKALYSGCYRDLMEKMLHHGI